MPMNVRLVLPVVVALASLPGMAFAEGAASSSASGFSWFANAPSAATAQARANARLQLTINTSRTWVCSPAGFGKRSTCISG
jgi:hypothetical protein